VLHNQVGKYENLKVEWVPGHAPTAFFHGENSELIKQVVIGDKDLKEVLAMLKENDFEPTKKKLEMGSPVKTETFSGKKYELYQTHTLFDEAKAFAESQSHDGVQGSLLTISSKEEQDWVSQLLQGSSIGTVWLGGQDQGQEGTWSWIGGPEKNAVFWKDGETVSYANWKEGEPNNFNTENCLSFTQLGWLDSQCDGPSFSVIVQYPTSTVVAADQGEKNVEL